MTVRRGKIYIVAAALSVTAHALLLGGFAAVHLGAESETVSSPLGAVSMRTEKKIADQPLITPKPQIKSENQVTPKPEPVVEPEKSIRPEPLPAPAQPTVQPNQPETAVPDIKPDAFEAEFFGQETVAHTLCFVVDCSGSMYGRLELIKQQLKNCIASLQDNQSFYLIFFMDGNKLLEIGDGKTIPAAGWAKSQAFDLVDRIRLEGKTNARQALERAMKIRDPIGRPVELIYFLTDGFDLWMSSPKAFCEEISNVRRKTAPSVCINTIGLWVSENDLKTLQGIAQMTGGQCIAVEEIHDDL